MITLGFGYKLLLPGRATAAAHSQIEAMRTLWPILKYKGLIGAGHLTGH
jgi:hypothetical protein